jgi:hypothetical protein
MKDRHRFFSDLHATEETLNTTVKNHYGTGGLVGRVYTQAEIGPLDNRSADAFRIGTAHSWDFLDGRHFRRRVPLFAVLMPSFLTRT